MAKENSISDSNQNSSLSALTLSEFKLPIRPGYGTDGRRIVLKTNYFRMEIDTSRKLYRYQVEVASDKKKRKPAGDGSKKEEPEPEVLGRRTKRRAFALLFENPEFQSVGDGLATDYSANVITTRKLDLGASGKKAFRITYREAEETAPRRQPTTYTFTLTSIGMVPTTELLRYLASTTSDPSDFAGKADAIQALNIIVARTPNLDSNVFQAGQNKFFHFPTDTREYNDLTGGLIAVRGYYSSVRTSTLRTLLNLNAQCSPFYPAINMMDLMEQHSRWDDRTWEALESFIEKLRVKTQYLKNGDGSTDVRVKTVVGLSHKFEDRTNPKTGKLQRYGNARGNHGNAQQLSFECPEFPEEKPITIERFFERKHGTKLRKPQAWVLNCGTHQNPVWIPPEVCGIMPGQPYRGKLSEVQTTQMLNVASRTPAENARRIVGAGQRVIGFDFENPSLTAFGVKIGRDMILVAGRILEPPPVLYKNKTPSVTAGASWNMIKKQFAVPGRISKWSFLTLGSASFSQQYLDLLTKALKDCGLAVEAPMSPPGTKGYHAPLTFNENENDTNIMRIFQTMSKAGIKFLLVILPTTNAITYGRVKFWADVKAGIHTVCAVESKLSKGPNYYANIALKFNLKCGGVNHLLPAAKLGFLAQGTTMVVGIDVTHPAPKSMLGCPSIAGVVASVDGMYGQWPGSIRCQKSRQEMVQDLDVMMKERLTLWREKNKKLPERILIYRDGVSEGQYASVLTTELDGIRKACEIYRPGPDPKITIMVVGKRHHTRFYPTNEADADRKGNPLNGTIVDRGVTMEKGVSVFQTDLRQQSLNRLQNDFYLQAHACLMGTVCGACLWSLKPC